MLLAAAALPVVVVALLWPVLVSPVQADDRYWYLLAPGDSGGSWGAVLGRVVADSDPSDGRLTPLAFLLRRLVALGVFDLSVLTGAPLATLHSWVKVACLVAVLAAVWAFVRAWAWRGADGVLRRPGRWQAALVSLVVLAGLAAGAQTQNAFRNAWVAYPLLTYGAVVATLGTVAVVLWLARRTAARRPGAVLVSAVVGLALAVALTTTYELYYVAVPAAVLALLLAPTGADGGADLRARLVAGVPLVAGFGVLLTWARTSIAAACADQDCYVGTTPSLGAAAVRTTWTNLLGSVPGGGRDEAAEELAANGLDPAVAGPGAGTLLLAAALAACVLVLWRALAVRADRHPDGRSAHPGATAGGRERLWSAGSQASALVRAAVVALAVAVGSAVIMSVSVQAQEVVVSLGQPYRHTVVTWTGLVLTGVLLGRAVQLRGGRAARWVPALAALVVGALVLLSVPVNTAATRASLASPATRAVEELHREAAVGDPTPEGDLRRCETVERVVRDWPTARAREVALRAADATTRAYFGLPWCSEGLGLDEG